jgi:hypothetical protein
MVGAGIALMIAGMSSLGTLWLVVSGMVVGETGFMLSNVSLMVAGTSSLEDAQAGLGAGLLNTSIQLGSGVGLGVVATVIAMSLPGQTAEVDAVALQWGLMACLLFVAVAITLVARGMRNQISSDADRERDVL